MIILKNSQFDFFSIPSDTEIEEKEESEVRSKEEKRKN